ncbi:hypothetical protein C5167_007879 [Papaver somniferum]|nr:hypothetical protein C5167_007879 [Papaver somniferum]
MGLSMKSQVLAEGKEAEGNKKWVVAGILVRTPLKAINTNKKIEDGDDEEQGCQLQLQHQLKQELILRDYYVHQLQESEDLH